MRVIRILCLFAACLLCFCGCTALQPPVDDTPVDPGETTAMKTVSLYIQYVDDTGFVADIQDMGTAFFAYSNAADTIDVYDTVHVAFGEEDVTIKSGSVNGSIEDRQITYVYVINAHNVRVADGSKEPVFG